MGSRSEQAELAARLRGEGAAWVEVVAECRARWGLNARQTIRIARGLSQQQVADEWCRRWPDDVKTHKNVSTWERWPEAGHCPSLGVLDRLARIYRCAVADLVSDFEDYGRVDDVVAAMDRRTMLAGLSGSLAIAAVPALRSKHVAPELAEYFDQQLRGHYQADMLLGPHLLIETVASQYQAICHAAEAATSEGFHRGLLRVGASYAALAGWLYQDAGNIAQSSVWRADALEMAHRASDPQLVSYALTNKAMLRVDVRDGVGAVDLATAALAEEKRLAPKVRIVALVQAAHGHALVGRRDEVDRALDTVADLTDRADDDWPWGNAFRRTPGYIDAQRATCYGRLGLGGESAELWGQVVRDQPQGYRRDSGVYLARYAAALLAAGEPVEATRRAARAVACLHDTGSARMRLELAHLRDQANRWTHTGAGRDLVDVLADIT